MVPENIWKKKMALTSGQGRVHEVQICSSGWFEARPHQKCRPGLENGWLWWSKLARSPTRWIRLMMVIFHDKRQLYAASCHIFGHALICFPDALCQGLTVPATLLSALATLPLCRQPGMSITHSSHQELAGAEESKSDHGWQAALLSWQRQLKTRKFWFRSQGKELSLPMKLNQYWVINRTDGDRKMGQSSGQYLSSWLRTEDTHLVRGQHLTATANLTVWLMRVFLTRRSTFWRHVCMHVRHRHACTHDAFKRQVSWHTRCPHKCLMQNFQSLHQFWTGCDSVNGKLCHRKEARNISISSDTLRFVYQLTGLAACSVPPFCRGQQLTAWRFYCSRSGFVVKWYTFNKKYIIVAITFDGLH